MTRLFVAFHVDVRGSIQDGHQHIKDRMALGPPVYEPCDHPFWIEVFPIGIYITDYIGLRIVCTTDPDPVIIDATGGLWLKIHPAADDPIYQKLLKHWCIYDWGEPMILPAKCVRRLDPKLYRAIDEAPGSSL